MHAGSNRWTCRWRTNAVGNQTTIGRIISSNESSARPGTHPDGGENFSRRFVPTSFIVSAIALLITGDAR